jgi:hypothetical protein
VSLSHLRLNDIYQVGRYNKVLKVSASEEDTDAELLESAPESRKGQFTCTSTASNNYVLYI